MLRRMAPQRRGQAYKWLGIDGFRCPVYQRGARLEQLEMSNRHAIK